MAIISAAEFLASREAREAGVSEVSTDDATLAISEAEAALEQELGYPVADSATSVTVYGQGEGFMYLPRRIRSVTSLTYGGTTLATTAYYTADEGFSLWRGARGANSPWYPTQAVVLTGTFGYDTTDPQYVLAKKAVRLLAARALQTTDEESNIPPNVERLSAEGVSFEFNTDDPEIQRLIQRIGIHPRKKAGLFTISMGGRVSVDFNPEMIFQGFETPDTSLR